MKRKMRDIKVHGKMIPSSRKSSFKVTEQESGKSHHEYAEIISLVIHNHLFHLPIYYQKQKFHVT